MNGLLTLWMIAMLIMEVLKIAILYAGWCWLQSFLRDYATMMGDWFDVATNDQPDMAEYDAVHDYH